MNTGKHVLCEKPLAVNQSQVAAMIEASHRNQVFLMEALWTRFNPSFQECLKLIQQGVIGRVNYVQADFTFFIDEIPRKRMMNPELAGGSLLEMGIYPIFLTYQLLGIPQKIMATGHLAENGTDLQIAVSLQFNEGIAQMMSGLASQSRRTVSF